MSTRCNIVIKCGGKFRQQLYHHCDGGFNFVGKELCRFLELFLPNRESLEDIADQCGNCLHYQDDQYEIEDDLMWENLHGDIDYVYYIDFINIEDDTVNISFQGKCIYDGRTIDYTYHRRRKI